jgi:hypothetical protein
MKSTLTIFNARWPLPLKPMVLLCLFSLLMVSSCDASRSTPTLALTPIPIPIIGPGRLCMLAPGETLPLAVTGVPGTGITYSWSANAGLVVPPDSPTVNYTAPETPGDVIIKVVAQKDGQTSEGMIYCKVVAPPVTSTPIPETATNTLEPTLTVIPTNTIAALNPTEALRAAFEEVDKQFANSLKGNIAFIKPIQMKLDETTRIELILNPSVPEPTLAATLVGGGGLVTSTADPNIYISPSGGRFALETERIEITPRMKAVLLSEDPEAFIIVQMNDDPEKVVGSANTTSWRWSITAKKKGSQTLYLVIYRLVMLDNEDFWHEVETYKANIVVKVTVTKWIESLDWKWVVGIIIAFVGSIAAVLSWLSGRNKKAGEETPVQTPKKKKNTRPKK